MIQLPSKTFDFPCKQGQFLKKAVAELARLRLEKQSQLKLGLKALLDRGFGSTSRGSHERLEAGDVVQVMLRPGCEDKKFLNAYMSNNGKPHFFVVGGFIRKDSHLSWGVVSQCTIVSPSYIGQLPDLSLPPLKEVSTHDFYNPQRPVNFHYLELSNKVRKVGVIHNCSKKGLCNFLKPERFHIHVRR